MTERAPRGLVEKKPAPQRQSRKPERSSGDGPLCPANPDHGRLLSAGSADFYFFCPHQEHDGRLASHPLGGTPPTKSVWRREELDKLAAEQ